MPLFSHTLTLFAAAEGHMTDSPLPPLQRSSPSSTQKSSRNDYMKSGLYSTFTIQSLQASPSPRPIKSEVMLQQDSAPKLDRKAIEVCACVFVCARPSFVL